MASCSSSTDNRVEVVEGGTSTTAATSETTAPIEFGEPTLSDDSEVTTVGLDAVEFGMTFEDAQAAAGTRFVPLDGETVGACYRVRPEEGPEGVTFVVSDGRIERVDVDAGAVTTRSGAGVGMPVGELTALYPDQLEASPGASGTTFTFVPTDEADAEYRIIFDTDSTVVTAFRAGKLPQVTEGC
jgi:hypothetical protein